MRVCVLCVRVCPCVQSVYDGPLGAGVHTVLTSAMSLLDELVTYLILQDNPGALAGDIHAGPCLAVLATRVARQGLSSAPNDVLCLGVCEKLLAASAALPTFRAVVIRGLFQAPLVGQPDASLLMCLMQLWNAPAPQHVDGTTNARTRSDVRLRSAALSCIPEHAPSQRR